MLSGGHGASPMNRMFVRFHHDACSPGAQGAVGIQSAGSRLTRSQFAAGLTLPELHRRPGCGADDLPSAQFGNSAPVAHPGGRGPGVWRWHTPPAAQSAIGSRRPAAADAEAAGRARTVRGLRGPTHEWRGSASYACGVRGSGRGSTPRHGFRPKSAPEVRGLRRHHGVCAGSTGSAPGHRCPSRHRPAAAGAEPAESAPATLDLREPWASRTGSARAAPGLREPAPGLREQHRVCAGPQGLRRVTAARRGTDRPLLAQSLRSLRRRHWICASRTGSARAAPDLREPHRICASSDFGSRSGGMPGAPGPATCLVCSSATTRRRRTPRTCLFVQLRNHTPLAHPDSGQRPSGGGVRGGLGGAGGCLRRGLVPRRRAATWRRGGPGGTTR